MNGFARMRKMSGLTQAQVAEKLRVDQSTVAKWETNESTPRTATMLQLSQILKCSINDFFEEMDDDAARDTRKR